MNRLLIVLLLVAGCKSADTNKYGIPAPYHVLQECPLDFNRDGVKDVLLVLHDSSAHHTSGEIVKRPLWILAGQRDSMYRRVLENDNVIPCQTCSEIGDNTFARLVVTDTTISFSQNYFASRGWQSSTDFSFAYNSDKKWQLVMVDYAKQCMDDDGKLIEGCDQEEDIHLTMQELEPPIYLHEFDIYNFDPLKYK